MTQTTRDDSSWPTRSSSDAGRKRALSRQLRNGISVDVVDDAFVTIAHEASDDVRAHPTESDHSEIHRVSS